MWAHFEYSEKVEAKIKKGKEKLATAVQATLSELHCSLCLDPLISPQALRCGHVYCYVCLIHWKDDYLERVINSYLVPCPQCREPIFGHSTKVFMIEAAIDKLYENSSRKEREERKAKVDERKGEGPESLFELLY